MDMDMDRRVAVVPQPDDDSRKRCNRWPFKSLALHSLCRPVNVSGANIACGSSLVQVLLTSLIFDECYCHLNLKFAL